MCSTGAYLICTQGFSWASQLGARIRQLHSHGSKLILYLLICQILIQERFSSCSISDSHSGLPLSLSSPLRPCLTM